MKQWHSITLALLLVVIVAISIGLLTIPGIQRHPVREIGQVSLPMVWWPDVPIVWSPDGKMLASASQTNSIQVWEVATPRRLHVLEGHAAAVCNLMFNHDSTRLVSASADHTVRLWDVQTGKELVSLPTTGRFASCEYGIRAAFSPDGTQLASLETNGGVLLTDASTGVALTHLDAQANDPYPNDNLAFSSDGSLLATASLDSIHLWNMPSGTFRTLLKEFGGFRLLFSPDSKYLGTYGSGGHVALWDLRTEKPINAFRFLVACGWVFEPDGTLLIADSPGDNANTMGLMDVATGKERYRIGARALTFSSDGKQIFTAGGDDFPADAISLWVVATGNRRTLFHAASSIVALELSPDDSQIAFVTEDGKLQVLAP